MTRRKAAARAARIRANRNARVIRAAMAIHNARKAAEKKVEVSLSGSYFAEANDQS